MFRGWQTIHYLFRIKLSVYKFQTQLWTHSKAVKSHRASPSNMYLGNWFKPFSFSQHKVACLIPYTHSNPSFIGFLWNRHINVTFKSTYIMFRPLGITYMSLCDACWTSYQYDFLLVFKHSVGTLYYIWLSISHIIPHLIIPLFPNTSKHTTQLKSIVSSTNKACKILKMIPSISSPPCCVQLRTVEEAGNIFHILRLHEQWKERWSHLHH